MIATDLQPLRLDVPEADLDYLRARLPDWFQGFDWRAQEARVNAFPQFANGDLRFLHVRSHAADALPLLLLHGRPGSVFDFLPAIDLLGDFHVVVPFGGAPHAWARLMEELGYSRYGVQSAGNSALDIGRLVPDRVAGVHVNGYVAIPSWDPPGTPPLAARDLERLDRLDAWLDTLGAAAVHRSPDALLRWWLDALAGELVDPDHLLAGVTLEWLLGATDREVEWEPCPVPLGVAVFARDVTIRRFAERGNEVVHWSEFETSGRFASAEVPELWAADVRAFFRSWTS